MTESPASIHIGDYTIGESYAKDPKKVGIYHKSGEGGDFDREEFYVWIDKFYKDNF